MNLKISVTQNYFILALFLIFSVSLLQYFILRPFEVGFSPDDWSFVFWYKSLGQNPILKLPEVWQDKGPYTTFFLYYLGGLIDIWGINYQTIGLTSIILKIIATISIFPLISVVFKNRLLAFLSVFLYAISYSSVGSLEFAVKGADYLSIFLMNLFLLSYCLLVKKNTLKTRWLPISILLFIITLISSTIRAYPILVLIPAIELFVWVKDRSLKKAKIVLIRLFLLYSPFIILLIYKPLLIAPFLLSGLSIFKKIIDGNWHLLLTPIQGLGFMFVPLEVWGHFIKPLVYENLLQYGTSLILGGSVLIWAVVAAIFAITTSKKPLNFFITAGMTNVILQVGAYILAFHSKGIPSNLQVNFDPPRLYSTANGIFVISLAIGYFKEWLSNKKDLILLTSWIALFSSLIFTTLTWVLADLNLGYKETSYYLVITSEGFAIFIAAILTLILTKSHKQGKAFFVKKTLAILLVVLISLTIFISSKQVINSFFGTINLKGRSYIGQNLIQERFRRHFKDIDFTKPDFFYFDPSDIAEDGTFFSEAFLSIFPHWIHIRDNKLRNGCSEVFYEDRIKLASFIQVKDGEKGIMYRSLCVKDGKAWYQDIFYKKENIYIFKLKNRDFLNIREETLKELGF